jgi:hypothetical protein
MTAAWETNLGKPFQKKTASSWKKTQISKSHI